MQQFHNQQHIQILGTPEGSQTPNMFLKEASEVNLFFCDLK